MPEAEPLDPKTLAIRPVTPADWLAFAALFESTGAPKNCWCMAWRSTAAERREASAAVREPKPPRGEPAATSVVRRTAMKKRIGGGVPVGLLAYAGDEPVAWCSIAPRPTYRKLGGPDDHEDDPDAVWSLACFFVKRAWRGQGVTHRLLDAAIAYARSEGARIVEAYPVAPDAPSYRFMGFVPSFEAAGFDKVGPAGNRRTVMRRRL